MMEKRLFVIISQCVVALIECCAAVLSMNDWERPRSGLISLGAPRSPAGGRVLGRAVTLFQRSPFSRTRSSVSGAALEWVRPLPMSGKRESENVGVARQEARIRGRAFLYRPTRRPLLFVCVCLRKIDIWLLSLPSSVGRLLLSYILC